MGWVGREYNVNSLRIALILQECKCKPKSPSKLNSPLGRRAHITEALYYRTDSSYTANYFSIRES